jgi:hypothetical protein
MTIPRRRFLQIGAGLAGGLPVISRAEAAFPSRADREARPAPGRATRRLPTARNPRGADQRCGWASGEGRRRGAIVTQARNLAVVVHRQDRGAGLARSRRQWLSQCLKPATLTPWRTTGSLRAGVEEA